MENNFKQHIENLKVKGMTDKLDEIKAGLEKHNSDRLKVFDEVMKGSEKSKKGK